MEKHSEYQEKWKYMLFPFFLALVEGGVSLLRRQDTNGDVWNYHLYNAYAWFNGRLGYDLGPAGAHSYLNPYLDSLFYFAILHLNPFVVAFLFGFLQGLVAFPIMYIARFFIKEKIHQFVLTAICCFGSTFFIGELGSSMHDNLIAVPILMSFCCVLKAIVEKENKALIFSGLLIGAATGLKLTSALYIPVFLVLISLFYGRRIVGAFSFLSSSFLTLMASSGVWYYKLYILFGNPLFPFFNNIFRSPYASLDKNATRDMMFFQFHGLEKVIYPFYFADHIDRVVTASNDKAVVCYTALFCFVLFALYFAIKIAKFGFKSLLGSRDNILFLFFFLSFYVWQYVFGVYRYFIPTDLICPIIFYVLIYEILNMQRTPVYEPGKKACWAAAVLVAVSFVKGVPDWGRGSYSHPYFEGNIPQEVKEADVLFNANFFSAWIVPVINPQGHVIQINRGLFDFGTKKYWDIYYTYLPKNRTPKQYVLFNDPNDQVAKNWAITKFKEHYNMHIDFSSCKKFPVRLSSYKSDITYCSLSVNPGNA